MRLVHNAGEGWIMDIEKPVKVALDSAVMVVGGACGTIDVSAATLTDMVSRLRQLMISFMRLLIKTVILK